jgi:hypothetical protein
VVFYQGNCLSRLFLTHGALQGSGRPEDEYKCLKHYPQLTMRTHVRALAAIVEHATKHGDAQGAFALGVKLCNLRAAAKWGVEHYQRRIQVHNPSRLTIVMLLVCCTIPAELT